MRVASMKAGVNRFFQTSFIICFLSIPTGNLCKDEPPGRCIFQVPPPVYSRSLASQHRADGGAPAVQKTLVWRSGRVPGVAARY